MTVDRSHEHFKALMAELGWVWDGKQPQPEQRMLLELCVALEDARRQIETKAGQVSRQAEEAARRANGHHPSMNSLGELQGLPAALEAAVGAFSTAQHLLDAFMKCYRPKVVCHPNPAIRLEANDAADLSWAAQKHWRLEPIPDDGENHSSRPYPCKTCTERERA